jgi:hypothetical protein
MHKSCSCCNFCSIAQSWKIWKSRCFEYSIQQQNLYKDCSVHPLFGRELWITFDYRSRQWVANDAKYIPEEHQNEFVQFWTTVLSNQREATDSVRRWKTNHCLANIQKCCLNQINWKLTKLQNWQGLLCVDFDYCIADEDVWIIQFELNLKERGLKLIADFDFDFAGFDFSLDLWRGKREKEPKWELTSMKADLMNKTILLLE